VVKVAISIKSDKKRVSTLYRTAQPLTLASFRSWGSWVGAGRIRLTRSKSTTIFIICPSNNLSLPK